MLFCTWSKVYVTIALVLVLLFGVFFVARAVLIAMAGVLVCRFQTLSAHYVKSHFNKKKKSTELRRRQERVKDKTRQKGRLNSLFLCIFYLSVYSFLLHLSLLCSDSSNSSLWQLKEHMMSLLIFRCGSFLGVLRGWCHNRCHWEW